jgi:short-subunit dehydrogenase
MAQTALITGASSGIGEDLARLLAAGGHDVVLLARNGDKLNALAERIRRESRVTASVLTADLSQPGAAEQVPRELAARGARVDILVNNAGFGTYGEFVNADAAETLGMLQVNIVSLTMLTRLLLSGMIERRNGRVLNVASTAAFQPGPLMAAYYASKAYVLSFSEALTEEVRGMGVTVTCLCPGPTQTEFQARAHMEKSGLLKTLPVMSSADVARAGYEGMKAGRALVIPGLMNKVGVQALRVTPRRLIPRIIRAIQAER